MWRLDPTQVVHQRSPQVDISALESWRQRRANSPTQAEHRLQINRRRPGGVAKSDATVNVNPNVQASLSVSPAEIRYHKSVTGLKSKGALRSLGPPRADTASLDPLGSVSPTGSRTVQPTPSKTDFGPVDETITYTLHSSNAAGLWHTDRKLAYCGVH